MALGWVRGRISERNCFNEVFTFGHYAQRMKGHFPYRQGFTLVEISIVLVIIGLIVGGILVGRDLMHEAELRSVISDINQYKTAFNMFREKYNCLPGDCPNATDFLGSGTANGNGNGIWDSPVDNDEQRYVWEHMSLSQLVGGNYSHTEYELGKALPASRVANAGYWAIYDCAAATPCPFWGRVSNEMIFGKSDSTNGPTNLSFNDGSLSPPDAYRVDSKIDDGNPSSGNMRAANGYDTALSGVGACTTAGPGADYNHPQGYAAYNMSSTDVVCRVLSGI